MAGTSRSGDTGGSESSADNQDDEDDNILYVPPRLNGLHLTVTWPIKCPVQCMIGKCGTKLKSENKYTVVNSL